ncbi:2'-5' RNA ligase family protein [Actinoplanes sp. NPDC049265]|uniref:2'-5' RNA ligase family protein n=1 Tax=Actinoplanes sp. NPDC049265 TaxID=3363902 RepID=UPI00371CD187
MSLETALIIPVPAAEPIVGAHRARFDRAATWGIPAHVTVLYPFLPLSEIRTAALAALFRRFAPFTARFDEIRWFEPRVVWAAPTPAAAFRELTTAVWEQYPAAPPFRGEFADIVPHLTIGHDAPREDLHAAGQDVAARLPFTAEITSVDLVAGLTGSRPWQTVAGFRLGSVS